jgi:hypothetical protein
MRNGDNTEIWKLYERGRAYNQRLSPDQYSLVSANTEFYAGNQWLNMPETPAMARLPKPVFNIIKRVASLFVASLTSTASTIRFETLTDVGSKEETDAAMFATSEVSNLLEKFHMEYRIREALFDGAITGDYCAHFYWNPDAEPYRGALGDAQGEIVMELIDGINVMFGNPNSIDVESQPYILIIGRDTVSELKKEAEAHAEDGGEPDSIKPDADYTYQAAQGGKTELEADDDYGKCLYIYMYRKETYSEIVNDDMGNPVLDEYGQMMTKNKTTVFVSKATQGAVIYKDIDTGLSRYPIAWGNWEKQKNQYHGRALVTGIIPNQIFINTMFAMVMRHLQLSGFPKTVYNASLIPKWNNEIGQAIGVKNLAPGQSLDGAAKNIIPADMSNQIIMAIDKALQYTKECLGATDAQMGNVKPENTSAIMVLQSNSEVPLENVRAGKHEWLENIGAILLDMMGTYYGERSVVVEMEIEEPVKDGTGNPIIDPMTGLMQVNKIKQRVARPYDFSQFKNLWLKCRTDVGASTYFSEIAMVQTLDNLRRDGLIDTIQYLERIPDRLIPRRQELIDELTKSIQQPMPQGSIAGVGSALSGDMSDKQAFPLMTPGMQGKIGSLPTQAKTAALVQAKLR